MKIQYLQYKHKKVVYQISENRSKLWLKQKKNRFKTSISHSKNASNQTDPKPQSWNPPASDAHSALRSHDPNQPWAAALLRPQCVARRRLASTGVATPISALTSHSWPRSRVPWSALATLESCTFTSRSTSAASSGAAACAAVERQLANGDSACVFWRFACLCGCRDADCGHVSLFWCSNGCRMVDLLMGLDMVAVSVRCYLRLVFYKNSKKIVVTTSVK